MKKTMTKEDFMTLTKNWNWSKTSLDIVYDLFVKNDTSKTIADRYSKTQSYINMYKSRFIEKKQKQKLETFINNNEPNQIKKYEETIYLLWDKGFDLNQINKYLINEEKINLSKNDLTNLINRRDKK